MVRFAEALFLAAFSRSVILQLIQDNHRFERANSWLVARGYPAISAIFFEQIADCIYNYRAVKSSKGASLFAVCERVGNYASNALLHHRFKAVKTLIAKDEFPSKGASFLHGELLLTLCELDPADTLLKDSAWKALKPRRRLEVYLGLALYIMRISQLEVLYIRRPLLEPIALRKGSLHDPFLVDYNSVLPVFEDWPGQFRGVWYASAKEFAAKYAKVNFLELIAGIEEQAPCFLGTLTLPVNDELACEVKRVLESAKKSEITLEVLIGQLQKLLSTPPRSRSSSNSRKI